MAIKGFIEVLDEKGRFQLINIDTIERIVPIHQSRTIIILKSNFDMASCNSYQAIKDFIEAASK